MNSILVDEAFFNNLLAKALPPPYLEDLEELELEGYENTYFEKIQEIIKEHKISAIAFLSSITTQSLFNNPLTLDNHFFDSVEDEIRNSTRKFETKINQIIDDQYQKGATEGFKQINRKFVSSIADEYTKKFIKNYNFDLIKEVGNDLKGAIRREIWEGATKGESAYKISKRIEKIDLKPIKAGNRVISPKERAKLIARTETMRVRNAANLMSYKHYGIEEVIVPRIMDSTECEKCIEVCENSPYSIDEAEGLLPVHPCCRHHYAPVGEAKEAPVNLLDDDYVYMIEEIGSAIA